MRILFLDDDPRRQEIFLQVNIGHVVEQAWTANDAIYQLEHSERFDLVSLDHDLDPGAYVGAPQEATGQEVARHLAQMDSSKRPARVQLHTFNPAGASAMAAYLREAGISAPWVPFDGKRVV